MIKTTPDSPDQYRMPQCIDDPGCDLCNDIGSVWLLAENSGGVREHEAEKTAPMIFPIHATTSVRTYCICLPFRSKPVMTGHIGYAVTLWNTLAGLLK